MKQLNGYRRLLFPIFFPIILCAACSSQSTPSPSLVPSSTPPAVEGSAISPTTPAEPTIAPPAEAAPEELPTEEPWELMLEDDFEDPSSGWERYHEFDGILDYEEGGYRMLVNAPANFFWVSAHQEYSDIRVEVDAKVIGGTEANRYGVLCRLGGDEYDYYFFVISSEGTYAIGKQFKGTVEILAESEERGDVINQGIEEYNHIRADCEADRLSLYVNNELLLDVQDADIIKGDVGLVAATFGDDAVDVYFDSIEVYAPKRSQEEGAMMPFALSSTAFAIGEAIPTKYSCDGEDVSPPLQWGNPPEGTRSFALISDDPDAPGGTWIHWVLYNIPAEGRVLPEAIPAEVELPDGSRHGENSWGRLDYGGPCPPSGTHRYFFRLYALDVFLNLEPGAESETLLQAMEGHILGQTELMGTYSR